MKTYIATENTQGEIRDLLKNIKQTFTDGGLGTPPHLTINTPIECTVTVSDGQTTVTPKEITSGVWHTNLPHLGTWEVTTAKEGRSNKTKVHVEEVKDYTIATSQGVRYGYRIKKTEGNPSARVEYLYDAVGLRPAKMNFTAGTFDYGDWGDKWFVTGNKPVMLKNDGTIDYELDPKDYSKKKGSGLASDVANESYEGNAMAIFPLVWVYRYEDADYLYEIISDTQYDENYKAYAHTRADGTIADWFAWSMYTASGTASKIRSLSGKPALTNLTATQEVDGAKANGAGWYTHTWSQRELIRTLVVLLGKSTDTQSVFGLGNYGNNSAGDILLPGTLNTSGQFCGYQDAKRQIKVFHVEGFWGDAWDRIAGVICDRGKIYVKMTPSGNGYHFTDTTGYKDIGVALPAVFLQYISKVTCTEYGIIPTEAIGSQSTYFADGLLTKNTAPMNCLYSGGGITYTAAIGGAFAFATDSSPSNNMWDTGCGITLIQPAHT